MISRALRKNWERRVLCFEPLEHRQLLTVSSLVLPLDSEDVSDPNPLPAESEFAASPEVLAEGTSLVTSQASQAASSTVLPPELPRSFVDTTYALPTGGTTHRVNAGDNLQSVLDAAQPGDVVELEAGATFTGNYALRPKTGDGWIYIVSSELSQLPAEGVRVSPEDAVHMPKIVAPNEYNPALIVEKGARNYRLVGIEITTAYSERDSVQYGLVRVGWGGASDQSAENITFDRAYIHGTTTGNIRDGIVAYDVRNWAIIDSHVSEFHGVGWESHAIHVYSSPGPTRIANNYIQAAGINIFIGDNNLGGAIPQDIEIVGNHIHKPWSWKPDHSEYAGIPWTVKNILEIKAAQRVLIDGNTMENVWIGAQLGHAIVITPRGAEIEDVTIRQNVLRDFQSGINLNSSNVRLDRASVENNLLYTTMPSPAYFMSIAGTPGKLNDLSIRHNTMLATNHRGWIAFNGSRENEVQGIEILDNLVSHGDYGILGNEKGVGLNAVDYYAQSYLVRNNAMIGGTASWYAETENFGQHMFPGTFESVRFSDTAFEVTEDFRLLPTSPYISAATDGSPLGALFLATAIPDQLGVSRRSGYFYLDNTENGRWDSVAGGDMFRDFNQPLLADVATPIVGDWDGNGVDDLGLFNEGLFYLDSNGNGSWDGVGGGDTFHDYELTVIRSVAKPVIGDWDGNGTDDLGLYFDGHFYLDTNGNGSWDSVSGGDTFRFFNLNVIHATATPVVGDWDGNGTDDLGLYRNGHFYLDTTGNGSWDSVSGGDTFHFFNLNVIHAVATPVVGDWDGDGDDDLGLHNERYFYLDSTGNGSWDSVNGGDTFYDFGLSGTPLVGIWTAAAGAGAALPVAVRAAVAVGPTATSADVVVRAPALPVFTSQILQTVFLRSKTAHEPVDADYADEARREQRRATDILFDSSELDIDGQPTPTVPHELFEKFQRGQPQADGDSFVVDDLLAFLDDLATADS